MISFRISRDMQPCSMTCRHAVYVRGGYYIYASMQAVKSNYRNVNHVHIFMDMQHVFTLLFNINFKVSYHYTLSITLVYIML